MKRIDWFVLNYKNASVIAVMVTHEPDWTQVQTSLNALVSQVAAVVIVDNASTERVADVVAGMEISGLCGIALTRNEGVGYAQNVGIQWAVDHAATHVLLMDQDSIPSDNMVSVLLAASLLCGDVAAVGPRYNDHRFESCQPFVYLKGFRFKRLPRVSDQSIVKVDCLISSGSLIPLISLTMVGPMRNDLFIDFVDTEWFLRARHHGLQAYGVCNATMVHKLGDEPFSLFGRVFPVHSPLRRYYQIRNALTLCRETWIPLNWKVAILWQSTLRFVFYSLAISPRYKNFRMMALGFWHALRGRTGKLPSQHEIRR